jgi:hypothetical protein
MALYEITIANSMDDTNYSKLVLSHEPLTIDNINIKAIAKIDEEWGEYISSISIPNVSINAWDAQEFNELDRLKTKLKY